MIRIYSERKPDPGHMTLYLWLLLLLGLMSSFAAVAEPAGRLLFAKGNVEVLREGEAPRMVTRGDVIDVGDTIRTGEKARAQLRLNDGAMVALRADTIYQIEAQRYDRANPQNSSQATNLLRGGLRAITGAIGKENPSAVKLSTPVATIGIRGTVYETIYVPPGGLPGMPDIPPGHYTLVLQGSVDLSNPAGALTLAVGEIGYVADADTPPALRPDLSWLFARYASFLQDGSSDGGVDNQSITITEGGSETGDIDRVLTETASSEEEFVEETIEQPVDNPPSGPVPTAGPFALVAARDSDGVAGYIGRFVTDPVTVGGGGELLLASNGSGDITSFDSGSASVLTFPAPGSYVAGDSTIYWGAYDAGSVTLGPSDLTQGQVDYINATQVLLAVSDLPVTGSYTYNYVGGTNPSLLSTSHLVVDFSNATMDVSLDTQNGNWLATGQTISDFYGTGIALGNASTGTGVINGRFVGSNAEGAMSAFKLDYGSFVDIGTAAFAR